MERAFSLWYQQPISNQSTQDMKTHCNQEADTFGINLIYQGFNAAPIKVTVLGESGNESFVTTLKHSHSSSRLLDKFDFVHRPTYRSREAKSKAPGSELGNDITGIIPAHSYGYPAVGWDTFFTVNSPQYIYTLAGILHGSEKLLQRRISIYTATFRIRSSKPRVNLIFLLFC